MKRALVPKVQKCSLLLYQNGTATMITYRSTMQRNWLLSYVVWIDLDSPLALSGAPIVTNGPQSCPFIMLVQETYHNDCRRVGG